MDESAEKKYWITLNTVAWVLMLVISAFAFFPAFIVLLVIWGMGRIKVTDGS